MASRGDGTYGRHSVLDGTGVVRPAPRTPARLAGWARRKAVLVPGRGVGGTGLAARTARSRQRGRRPRASGGGGDDGLQASWLSWCRGFRGRPAQLWPSNRLVTEPSLNTSL